MSLLAVRGLGFERHGGRAILAGVSFTLDPGGAIAVLGANGAGKTTLLSIIAGKLVPGQGSLEYFDGTWKVSRDSGRVPPRSLASRIAYLPQIERLPYNYRVLDFVLMGRSPHVKGLSQPGAEDKRLAGATLAELGLSHLARRGAADISGGEFQLARIARCLVQGAEILLLDEPSSLLDPANAARIAGLLAQLRKKGVGIIFTTHDAVLASDVADTVLLLAHGKEAGCGAPGLLLTAEKLAEIYGVDYAERLIPHPRPVAGF